LENLRIPYLRSQANFVLFQAGARAVEIRDKLRAARRTDLRVLTVSSGMALPIVSGAGADPHVWLDPVLVRDNIVAMVTAALGEAEPAQRPAFESSAASFRTALTALDAEIRDLLAPFPDIRGTYLNSAASGHSDDRDQRERKRANVSEMRKHYQTSWHMSSVLHLWHQYRMQLMDTPNGKGTLDELTDAELAMVVPVSDEEIEAAIERGSRIVGVKPVSLLQAIVQDYSRRDDLIVDPCAGSGTTLLAAAIEAAVTVAQCSPRLLAV
jgi:hypothetical protein